MSDLDCLVKNIIVPHSAFQRAITCMDQMYKYATYKVETLCLAIVGELRTGKTEVMTYFREKHPEDRDSEGKNVPILRVTTPSKPTVKSLVELMLYAIGDEKFGTGTENGKTSRLLKLMRLAGTRMVMIDEFQHFFDKGSHKVMHHVADWLKILVDESKVALVVAGLESCSVVIDQNEQLAGRFGRAIHMPRFDWEEDEQRNEFISILEAFQVEIGQYFDFPRFDTQEMAFRIYCGTGGLIGYLSKFLNKAVWNALDDQRKSISLEDFAMPMKLRFGKVMSIVAYYYLHLVAALHRRHRRNC